MNRITVIVVFMAGFGGLLGCGGKQTERGGDGGEGSGARIAHEDSATSIAVNWADSTFGLELDEGKKWAVDEHTRTSASRMASIVAGAGRFENVSDGTALADTLQAELYTLVRGCTMEGPAHEEIHVFLDVIYPAVAQLREGSTVGEMRASRQKIEGVFAAYGRHFE